MVYIFHYHGYYNYYGTVHMNILISIHIFLLKSSSPVTTELKEFFSQHFLLSKLLQQASIILKCGAILL